MDFSRVPVLDITKDNFEEFLPSIRLAIKEASFVALDCELSGLGERKRLNDPTVDGRFAYTSLVAKTRSIISLGLSLFKSNSNSSNYVVRTYNIVVLCSEDYIVEPGSLQFLVHHGFDFGKQYSKGVPYHRGDDKDEKDQSELLRSLFEELMKSGKSIVLHNGFIDLVFLYQNLYARLPQTLQTFVADLSEMFPGGIFDTKYLADYVLRTQASYLEYIFSKLKFENADKKSKDLPHLRVEFPVYKPGDPSVNYRSCGGVGTPEDEEKDICDSYADHGHCPMIGSGCSKSHNIDRIVTRKRAGKKRKKRKLESDSDEKETNNGISNGNNSDGHRAGFDAFMTGYAFAAILLSKKSDDRPLKDLDFVNKIYLVRKDFPLIIRKSSFAKNSASHVAKRNKMLTK